MRLGDRERARPPASPPPGAAPATAPPPSTRFAILAPAAAAGAYLVFFLTDADRLLKATFLNSDVASIPLLTEDMLRGSRGTAHIGVASYASTFIFGFLTRGLPGHRTLWELWSLGLSWAAVALLAWAAWRVAGTWAAVLTGAVALAASPLVVYNVTGLRGPTWFTEALLLAALVLIATLPPGTGRWAQVCLVVGVGVVAGTNLASDPLLLVGGLAPFLGAAAATALLLRRRSTVRALALAGGTAAVMVASAVLTARFMHVAGFRTFKNVPLGVAGRSEVAANLGMFGHALLAFANGEFPRPGVGIVSLPGLVLVLLIVFALAAPLRLLAALRRRPGRRPAAHAEALALFCCFWAITVVAVGAAFIFSTLPVGGVAAGRYLVPLFLALASGVGLWGDLPWPRLAAAGVVTVFCVMSIAGLATFVRYLPTAQVGMEEPTLATDGGSLVSFLEAHGLTRGYGGYWESLSLTWASGRTVRIYPVIECQTPPPRALCDFPLNAVSSWYRPGPAARTFLLVSSPLILSEPAAPPPAYLGPPVAAYRVGGFSVYVYGYDVATKLRPL